MNLMDFDELFPQRGKVLGRVVAVGYCPHCGPGQSVTITQPVLEWKDQAQTEPAEYGRLEMNCGICGSTIDDVELPLDETKWQLLIAPPKPRAKIVSIARSMSTVAAAAKRRRTR